MVAADLAMEAAIFTVAMGVMKPLLSKLADLVQEEYVKTTGVHKNIEFLREELSTMSATLEMLADADEDKLTAEMRDWRDKLRDLAIPSRIVLIVQVDSKDSRDSFPRFHS